MKLGLRLEWLLTFGALLVLSFVPLFFAVSRLTEASMTSVRERAARDLGAAIARHAEESARTAPSRGELGARLEAEIDGRRVVAIAIFDREGVLALGPEAGSLPAELEQRAEASRPANDQRRRLEVTSGATAEPGAARALVLVSIEPGTGPSSALIRLMALYTGVVGLALLVFGYFLMTRLVVRPVEQLSHAASRVASGARTLDLPNIRPRELDDLGVSLRAMTDRLRADEQSLVRKVTELEATARDLKSTQDTLVRSERLASVGRLAAGLAHEIGNPIAAILGFQELLLDGDVPPDEAHDFLVRMKRETERVHRVLRNLLDFARSPVKRGESVPSPSDVGHAIEGVITLVAPQRDLKGVSIDREIAADLPMVALAEEQLVQVLLNLLLNAGDAVSPTEGKIHVRAVKNDRGGVTIHVDDNGPGIADEVRSTLFEPFTTTKEVGKGTGLGLAVCRGIVESAGGTITAGVSALGGARFAIDLAAYATGPTSAKASKT